MAIPQIPDVRDMVESGVHFGHASGHWHPKMKPYIFATRDKLHIIDLTKTQEKLKETLGILEERIRDGKTIILVGTKNQVSNRIKEIGEANNILYVNVRWLGGMMTNFPELSKSISRMKKVEAFLETEEASHMIKKERVMMEADLRRMHYKFGGLRNMTRKPDALFIIDPGHEHNAVKEARHEGIETFAVIDTNCDPSLIDHIIPANDEGTKSLKMLLDLIEQTIQSGQKLFDLRRQEIARQEETEVAEAAKAAEVEVGEVK